MEIWQIVLLGFSACVGFLGVGYVLLYLAFLKGYFVPYPRAGYWVGMLTFWPTLPVSLFYRRFMRGEAAFSAVDDVLYVGRIVLPWDVAHLQAAGITHVINMLSEYSGPRTKYAAAGIEQLSLPTIDHMEPDADSLAEAVAFVEAAQNQGGRALVHCRAGHGRSASVALAWLISNHGLSPSAAQRYLDGVRTVRSGLYLQPAIREYAARIGADEDL